jgi:vacuolar-type H+-ATPase subunit E/Vma4
MEKQGVVISMEDTVVLKLDSFLRMVKEKEALQAEVKKLEDMVEVRENYSEDTIVIVFHGTEHQDLIDKKLKEAGLDKKYTVEHPKEGYYDWDLQCYTDSQLIKCDDAVAVDIDIKKVNKDAEVEF